MLIKSKLTVSQLQNSYLLINNLQRGLEMEKQYKVIEQIGKGSFGVVKKVARLTDNKVFVAKQMNYGLMNSHQKQQLISQVNILKELRHPNIVRYQDRIVDKSTQTVYIIMEYCEGGDLGTLIKDSKSKGEYIHQNALWKIFMQIISALHFCHNRESGKILHRDIKPANIFIDKDNNIKLGDFGLSRQMGQHSEFAKSKVGTPFYMSPQQIADKGYNQKSDIWSTGCILYQMAALKRPFQAKNHFSLAQKIRAGNFERLPIRYSQNLQALIRSMLNIAPQRRISTSQILQIPVIKLKLQNQALQNQYKQLREYQRSLKKKQAKLLHKKQQLVEMLQNKQNVFMSNI